MDVTIGYITARREPELSWFFDSLRPQLIPGERPTIIIVDILAETRDLAGVDTDGFNVKHLPCKPNVWQGRHRLTPRDWWAVSNYRNTAACLCRTKWFGVCDDRSVVAPTYLAAVRRAMSGGYACAGRYEKRIEMRVEGGVIVDPGEVSGVDPRFDNQPRPVPIGGGSFFGATSVQPLDFVLRINGWDESCDSLGLEDCIYGRMLERNGFPIRYDPELSITEDRSSWAIEPPLAIRGDKGISPEDKSHGLLKKTAGQRRATHDTDLRAIRDELASGGSFPIPTGPTHDWWDNQPLSEFRA